MGRQPRGRFRGPAGPPGTEFPVVQGDIAAQSADALDAADERGRESLVVPALCCGVAGFDLEEGARIVAGTIADYEPSSLSDVRFVAHSDEGFETVRRVASSVREGSA